VSGPIAQSVDLPEGEGRDLRTRARDALLAGITTGSMAAGVIYSVPLLAEQLDMSATPVREALLELAQDGLVEPVKNRGFRVTPITDKALDEICEIRELLEVPAAVAAANSISVAAIDRLEALAGDIHKCAESRDLVGYLTADREFHMLLLGAGDNAALVTLVGKLRDLTRLFGLQNLANAGELTPSADEHLEMVALLRAGEAKQLGALMRRHIRHTRDKWAAKS
jgi:DNA-binding GntR family transcriptional regulator